MWFFPWSTIATIAAMVVILVAMAVTPGLKAELFASLVCVAIIAAAYQIVRYKRKHAAALAAGQGEKANVQLEGET
jgi:GABA permease